LIASIVFFALGTKALMRPPRMNGTSASDCLTSSIRCGVSHGPFVSVSSSPGPPTGNVLLLKSVAMRALAPPPGTL
jgi:hypothetical protein